MDARLPAPLRPGDTIAVTAPSSGVPPTLQPRLDLAVAGLRRRGFEVVEGDASEASDVARAMEDVDVAWYLLHSMSTSDDFVSEEKEMASTFADAARDALTRSTR